MMWTTLQCISSEPTRHLAGWTTHTVDRQQVLLAVEALARSGHEASHFVGLNVPHGHVTNGLLQERLAVLANNQNQVTQSLRTDARKAFGGADRHACIRRLDNSADGGRIT